MLLQSLYQISEFNSSGEEFSATISFNPDHDIFKGHFPGQPVVPGVCLIHIVKELANMISGKQMLLQKGNSVKFLQLIDPRKGPEVIIKGKYSGKDESGMTISATISNEEAAFFKFKGLFT
ncbi:MAG: hypothetical protein V2I47_09355 [Bacteroidales bacterium]|jgi:3-hydroxyacyl-[acyl-carrier-protein] dehydratase|nr:hypothetical protein [Bacteroidales bacterium]